MHRCTQTVCTTCRDSIERSSQNGCHALVETHLALFEGDQARFAQLLRFGKGLPITVILLYLVNLHLRSPKTCAQILRACLLASSMPSLLTHPCTCQEPCQSEEKHRSGYLVCMKPSASWPHLLHTLTIGLGCGYFNPHGTEECTLTERALHCPTALMHQNLCDTV